MRPKPSQLPKLTTARAGGEIWVMDEKRNAVAMFRIKLPECHLAGSEVETFDAGLNLDEANALIERLSQIWTR